jgi:hypothetical protein
MSRRELTFKPLSLAQHFEAPDGFLGRFGWVCGYSADVGFLDSAVDRFTRRMHAQRAYEGRIAMALMLDPSNPQITPKEVPGVIHLPMKDVRPFRLMHAKLAILGYRHTSDARQWRLRLIVSTGNWTRQTSEESLDLAWRIELSNQDLKSQDGQVAQSCADIRSAWNMLNWLRGNYDLRVLNTRVPGCQGFESESTMVEKWIAEATELGIDIAPRVFDNRRASLLSQLPELVRQQASSCSRKYLAMGSGFYESPDNTNNIPSVIANLVDTLQNARLITGQPDIDVFVNPQACQAVAKALPSFNDAGWRVREAGQPEYIQIPRSLHAKFIFSANRRQNSELCNSAWLYLGSGNLTGPGFANRMAPQRGNLEAGVVFAPASLRWDAAKGIPPESVVTNLLPMQWDTELKDPGLLAAGSESPRREAQYSAAPIAYFFWIVDQDDGWLRADEEDTESFDLLDDAGDVCWRDPSRGFPWRGQRPRQVQLRWWTGGQERRAWVPVIDEYGRIAATILPRIEIEEAWNQLASFPMPPDEEELLANGEAESPDAAIGSGSRSSIPGSYPVHRMMELVENIAAKQTSVSKADWVTWCAKLEQCLIQAAGSDEIEEFLKLKLNPLSPLWHGPFRPGFASTGETVEGLRYERVLERVETAWSVTGLTDLGDRK